MIRKRGLRIRFHIISSSKSWNYFISNVLYYDQRPSLLYIVYTLEWTVNYTYSLQNLVYCACDLMDNHFARRRSSLHLYSSLLHIDPE